MRGKPSIQHLFALAGLALLATVWAPAVQAGPAPAAAVSKVAPSLRRVLAEDERPQRVWVFFADKGVAAGAERLRLDEVAAGYDPRAIERRRQRGSIAGLFDARDLPVHDPYAEAVAGTGATLRVRSRWLNAASAVATAAQIDAIAKLPFVTRVQLVARAAAPEPVEVGLEEPAPPSPRAVAGTLDYGLSTSQLEQINLIALHEAGFTGQGVVIGILDTGFRRDHDAFHQFGHELNVIAEYDFVNDDPETGPEAGDPSTQHNHGTLILGTIGAYYPGQLVGGAFNASFVLAKTEDVAGEYQGEEDNYVAGLEFIEANGADLATSSLGYIDWYTQADLDGQTAVTTIAVNAATARGLHCLNAAGNDYHDTNPATSSLIAPADALQVITIGAVTSSGTIASFSSDGPSADGRVKPEVLALGSSTQTVSSSSTTSFTTASGTSLSTPLAAAALACLVQARPGWSVDTLREQLFLNADWDAGGLGFDPTFVRGYGILDALATHVNASGMNVDPGTDLVVEGPVGGPFEPGGETYTLANNNDTPIDYLVTADQPWLDVTPASGVLPANDEVEVVVTLNAAAAALEQGSHTAILDFVNTTDHDGDLALSVVLHAGRTMIAVTPDAVVELGGAIGGPFGGDRVFTVASLRPTPVEVEVAADPRWIALDGATSPPRFWLDGAGASRQIVVAASYQAAVLPGGVHEGTVSFTNLTSGEGDATRAVSLEAGGPQPVHVVTFDEDPGWSTTGDWQFGPPAGGGTHNGDPTSGRTGSNVYGYNLAGDYPNNMAVESLTSAPFDCSAADSVSLRFWRWLGVESPTYDHVAVQASNNGTDWTTVWTNDSPGGAISDSDWTRVSYDLSAIADGEAAVSLRWTMGTTDLSVTYPGWNIDDVELLGVSATERLVLLLGSAELVWTPLPQALAFDAVTGDLATLRASGGDFVAATEACVANDTTDSTAPLGPDPAPGQGAWYLVRGVDSDGPMSYDAPGSSQVGSRDAEIGVCP